MNVRVVIEVEPKVPKGPKDMETKFRDATLPSHQTVFRDATIPTQQTIPTHRSTDSTDTGTWILIGSGVTLLTITIIADFLTGVSVADDFVTIPAALRMIGTGAARLLFPVTVRSAVQSGAYFGAGMALKAAH